MITRTLDRMAPDRLRQLFDLAETFIDEHTLEAA